VTWNDNGADDWLPDEPPATKDDDLDDDWLHEPSRPSDGAKAALIAGAFAVFLVILLVALLGGGPSGPATSPVSFRSSRTLSLAEFIELASSDPNRIHRRNVSVDGVICRVVFADPPEEIRRLAGIPAGNVSVAVLLDPTSPPQLPDASEDFPSTQPFALLLFEGDLVPPHGRHAVVHGRAQIIAAAGTATLVAINVRSYDDLGPAMQWQ